MTGAMSTACQRVTRASTPAALQRGARGEERLQTTRPPGMLLLDRYNMLTCAVCEL